MLGRIDRASPMPYYHQLKQILIEDIARRELKPGDRLPGDFDLCEAYGVSRTVVRQTLAELEYEGVIERVKGRGTFVALRKTPEGLVQHLTGLYEDVASRGGHLRSDVRRLEVVPADGQIAEQLQLPASEPVIVIERLRYVDEVPWVLAVTHVPQAIAPGLVHEDLTEQSLYHVLEDKYGVRLARGRRSVEAAVASASLARSLGIGSGAPVLVLRSVGVDDQARPVESFVAFHRGDRSRFEVELARDRSAGAAQPLMVVTD